MNRQPPGFRPMLLAFMDNFLLLARHRIANGTDPEAAFGAAIGAAWTAGLDTGIRIAFDHEDEAMKLLADLSLETNVAHDEADAVVRDLADVYR